MNDGSQEHYERNAKDYALWLVESGEVTADHLAMCCVKAMGDMGVQNMLDINELSPRFRREGEEA